MKKYLILSGAMAAAVLCGTDAMAQLNYQNGDMLAGFGKAGSTVDVIVDLGSISQFQQPGASPISFSGVSAALTSTFGGTSGLYWAVFGVNDTSGNSGAFNGSVTQADPNTVWDSYAQIGGNPPYVSGNSGNQNNALGDIQGVAFLAANSTYSTTLSPNIAAVSSGAQLAGFTPEFATGGNLNGDWSLNMLGNGSGSLGLYQSDPGNSAINRQSYLGTMVLDPSGNLTFNAVPEPSTWALVGGGLTTLLLLRRRNK